ncbi:MAG: hypothetical protein HFJ27_00170 [Clostridia bacterium]|nr:hypothetical protein [Clostridia bacterium]
MLQEEAEALWYHYGYGRNFARAAEAIAQIEKECEELGIDRGKHKVVINDECESVRLIACG